MTHGRTAWACPPLWLPWGHGGSVEHEWLLQSSRGLQSLKWSVLALPGRGQTAGLEGPVGTLSRRSWSTIRVGEHGCVFVLRVQKQQLGGPSRAMTALLRSQDGQGSVSSPPRVFHHTILSLLQLRAPVTPRTTVWLSDSCPFSASGIWRRAAVNWLVTWHPNPPSVMVPSGDTATWNFQQSTLDRLARGRSPRRRPAECGQGRAS